MINEYHILIKKLVSKRVKKGLKNKLYLFYLNKILKFLKVLKTRIGLKIIGEKF